jgi:hypothetical protein
MKAIVVTDRAAGTGEPGDADAGPGYETAGPGPGIRCCSVSAYPSNGHSCVKLRPAGQASMAGSWKSEWVAGNAV